MSFSSKNNFDYSHNTIMKRKASALVTPRVTKILYACTIPICNLAKSFKRKMSPFFFLKLNGAASVEAAIAVPLFLFFIANLLYLLIVFGEYSTNLASMGQSAKQIACLSYDTQSDGDEIVSRWKLQNVTPFTSLVGYKPAKIYVCMKYRKWNGYDAMSAKTGVDEEEYVYITQTGSKYHRSANCYHLSVEIHSVTESQIASSRNDYGEKYRPCERCRGISSGLLLITPDGNRYHTMISCSGLKRTIKAVKISEVGGRLPCSDCGK